MMFYWFNADWTSTHFETSRKDLNICITWPKSDLSLQIFVLCLFTLYVYTFTYVVLTIALFYLVTRVFVIDCHCRFGTILNSYQINFINFSICQHLTHKHACLASCNYNGVFLEQAEQCGSCYFQTNIKALYSRQIVLSGFKGKYLQTSSKIL